MLSPLPARKQHLSPPAECPHSRQKGEEQQQHQQPQQAQPQPQSQLQQGTGTQEKLDATLTEHCPAVSIRALAVAHERALESILARHLVQQANMMESFLAVAELDGETGLEAKMANIPSVEQHPFEVVHESKHDEMVVNTPIVTATSRHIEQREAPAHVDSPKGVPPTDRGSNRGSGSLDVCTRSVPMPHARMTFIERCLAWLQAYESDADTPLQKVIHGTIFKMLVAALIIANTFTLGFLAEHRVTAVVTGSAANTTWDDIEIMFSVIFCAELLLRLTADRWKFFNGFDFRWNVFDLLLVLHSIIYHAVHLATPGKLQVLQTVRFLRILRLVRVLRSISSFRVMVSSILGSMKTLLIVSLWLTFVLYTFSVFFLGGFADSYPDLDTETQSEVRDYYGSVVETLISLFMSVSGGDDWGNRMRPFRSMSVFYLGMFLFYIFFMVVGVLSIVVGAFVETAAEVSRRDRDSVIENEIRETQDMAANIRSFFQEADRDGSGQLSQKELEDHLQDARVKAYFASLDIEVSQATDLFSLLDVDDSGNIGVEEFLGGCMRLRGSASSMDVNLTMWEIEKLMCKVCAFSKDVEAQFTWLADVLGAPMHIRRQMTGMNPRKKKFRNMLWTGVEGKQTKPLGFPTF